MRILIFALLSTAPVLLLAESDRYSGPVFEIYPWIGNKSEEISVEKFADYDPRQPVVSRSEEFKVAVEVHIKKGEHEPYPLINTEPVALHYQVRLHAACAQSNPWLLVENDILVPPTRSHGHISFGRCEDLALGNAVLEATLYNAGNGTVLNRRSVVVTIHE